MKFRFSFILLICLSFLLITSCSNEDVSDNTNLMENINESSNVETNNSTGPIELDKDSSKILVAYFSRAGENYRVGNISEGNTEKVAKVIAEKIGGTLFKIETVEPYPENYDECTAIAKQQLDENARPELKDTVRDFSNYETIYLGYPIWYSNMPMPVYTFLDSYDFSGKNIYPFCTNEGSGLGDTVDDIKVEASTAIVHEGLAITGTTAQEDPEETDKLVTDWLN